MGTFLASEYSGAAAAKSLQSCLTLCDPIDGSPPGSSIHGIFQARVLEWVTMPSSRGSSQPRDQTQVSCIASGFLTLRAMREALICKQVHRKGKEEAEEKEENDKIQIKRQSVSDDDSFGLGDGLSRGM